MISSAIDTMIVLVEISPPPPPLMHPPSLRLDKGHPFLDFF